MGEGMVQLWQEQDRAQRAVDLVASDRLAATGWRSVPEGQDQSGQRTTLVHEDLPALRRMAVFDLIIDDVDRKGDHILAMADGHRYGVDQGLTFHRDPKLRTVLWGRLGDALTAEELDGIERVSEGLHGELGRRLRDLLSPEEGAARGECCAWKGSFRPRTARCPRCRGLCSEECGILRGPRHRTGIPSESPSRHASALNSTFTR